MAQPQHQAPARVFSPPQPPPAQAPSPAGYANKRPRLSPVEQPQPTPPYSGSPYAISPGTVVTPGGSAASPSYMSAQIPLPTYTHPAAASPPAPYTNGHSTTPSSLNLPISRPTPAPNAPVLPKAIASPATPSPVFSPIPANFNGDAANTQYSSAALTAMPSPVPLPNSTPMHLAPAPGAMGPPPTKPGDRPAKEAEHDFADTLAGTGIDLNMEEQLANETLFNLAKEPQTAESRMGFAYHPPGNRASLYGAGPMNQAPEATTAKTPAQLAAEVAKKAWTESAENLAVSRMQELNNPFLLVAILHRRTEKIAKEYGLSLNLDTSGSGQTMGRMKLPNEIQQPTVTVSTKTLPDSTAVVHTTGSWIPKDAQLVDQLALMSIAAKERFRGLVYSADVVAAHRQITSHGEVPEIWGNAAAPLHGVEVIQDRDGHLRTGAESAVSPRTNPLKRSIDATNIADDAAANAAKVQKISTANSIGGTVRDIGRGERDWEEARLRRRNNRRDGVTGGGMVVGDPSSTPASRAGSVAPATPGSVAPELGSDKAMSKKEQKKTQAARQAEAASHASQNQTSNLFAGLGRSSGLFGKKGGKSYSWMNAGAPGSGASTPTRNSTPGPSGRLSNAPPPPTNLPLTAEGRNRLGTWREDKEKGKNIQLRDWLAVLQRDGIDREAIQHAYGQLDSSAPK